MTNVRSDRPWDPIQTTVWTLVPLLIAFLLGLRLIGLADDPPLDIARDGFLYTDEGWYTGNALWWARTGEWYSQYNLNNAVPLPISQLFHGIAFSLFGPTAEVARLVVLASFLGTLGLLWVLLRDSLAATIAIGFLAVNHLAFAYSRIAIAEVQMGFFALLAVVLALRAQARRTLLMAFLAAMAAIAAMLTKTSAVHVLPLVAGILFWKGGLRWRGALLAAGFLLLVLGIVAAHGAWASSRYPYDYQIFYAQNMGQRGETHPARVLEQGSRLFRYIRRFERIALYPALAAIPLLLFFQPVLRKKPLPWIALAWFALYLGAFSFFARTQPRYYAGMLAPAALVIALPAAWAFRQPRRTPWPWAAAAILAISLLWNVEKVAGYLLHRDDSFRRLARATERALDDANSPNRAVFAHFSQTLALHGDILPVSSVFAWSPVWARWELYQPLVLASQGPIESDLTFAEALSEHARWELLSVHDVLENYRDYRVHLYRLYPLEEEEP